MFARVELVPTAAERVEWYFEGIYKGDNLYDGDEAYPDPVRHTTGGPSDTEGPSSCRSNTEGSNQEGESRSPVRQNVNGFDSRCPDSLELEMTLEEALEGIQR